MLIRLLLAAALNGGVLGQLGELWEGRRGRVGGGSGQVWENWREEDGNIYTLRIGEEEGATATFAGWGIHMRDGSPAMGDKVDVAFKYVNTTMPTEGWNYLTAAVSSDSTADDRKISAALGWGEGYVTAPMIYDAWRNTMSGYCTWQGEEYCDRLRQYISINGVWMMEMIEKRPNCPIWHQIELLLLQQEGLIAGYGASDQPPIPAEELLWMNMAGDLEDLSQALKFQNGMEMPLPPQLRGNGHCSALIKLTPGNTDIFTSHVTWNSLQAMLRLQKRYITAFTHDGAPIAGNEQTFSSYPAAITSLDDFYTVGSGLVTMETTIGNGNPDRWEYVQPEGQVLEYIRVAVANRLATNGKEWTEIFSKFNSGTYNNQWMIVDYNKFTPLQPVAPDTLWVAEQLPGLIVSKDMSQHLQSTSYWPSYNIPAFPEVFNASGQPAFVDEYGDWFSYDESPRALIFARDHGSVTDLGSMIKLMRYNNYEEDPLSACDCTPPYSGENGISARSDLNPANGTYPFPALERRSHAGTDMKVTNRHMQSQLTFLAQAGPTYDDLPVFKWSTSTFEKDTAHFGHPDSFEFDVVDHLW